VSRPTMTMGLMKKLKHKRSHREPDCPFLLVLVNRIIVSWLPNLENVLELTYKKRKVNADK